MGVAMEAWETPMAQPARHLQPVYLGRGEEWGWEEGEKVRVRGFPLQAAGDHPLVKTLLRKTISAGTRSAPYKYQLGYRNMRCIGVVWLVVCVSVYASLYVICVLCMARGTVSNIGDAVRSNTTPLRHLCAHVATVGTAFSLCLLIAGRPVDGLHAAQLAIKAIVGLQVCVKESRE